MHLSFLLSSFVLFATYVFAAPPPPPPSLYPLMGNAMVPTQIGGMTNAEGSVALYADGACASAPIQTTGPLLAGASFNIPITITGPSAAFSAKLTNASNESSVCSNSVNWMAPPPQAPLLGPLMGDYDPPTTVFGNSYTAGMVLLFAGSGCLGTALMGTNVSVANSPFSIPIVVTTAIVTYSALVVDQWNRRSPCSSPVTWSAPPPSSPSLAPMMGSAVPVKVDGVTPRPGLISLFSGATCSGTAVATSLADSGTMNVSFSIPIQVTSPNVTYSVTVTDKWGRVSPCSMPVSWSAPPPQPPMLGPLMNGAPSPTAVRGIVDGTGTVSVFKGISCSAPQLVGSQPVSGYHAPFSIPVSVITTTASFSALLTDAWGRMSSCVSVSWTGCDEQWAATRILGSLGASPDPHRAVMLVRNVVPGSQMIEQAPPDLESTAAATLGVPSTPDLHYFAFLDDHTGLRFRHSVRYASVSCSTNVVKAVSANWPPLVMAPGAQAAPYVPASTVYVDGVMVDVGDGGFAGVPDWVEGKVEARRSDTNEERRALLASLRKPPTSAKVESTSVWTKLSDLLLPSAYAQLTPPPGLRCAKYAIVIDGGGENTFRQNIGVGAMADEADQMETYLKRHAFEVFRYSQFWKSPKPGLSLAGGRQKILNLIDDIGWVISDLNQSATPCGRAHEVFFAYSGHGSKNGMALYESNGSGKTFSITYKAIVDRLTQSIPKDSVLYALSSACQAGGLLSTTDMPTLAKQSRGVRFMTSVSDSEDEVSSPTGAVDSGMVDFLQGLAKDYDNDNRTDDVGDAWLKMEGDALTRSPKQYWAPAKNDVFLYSLE